MKALSSNAYCVFNNIGKSLLSQLGGGGASNSNYNYNDDDEVNFLLRS